MAVFGRSSAISCGNWSTKGWIVTGSKQSQSIVKRMNRSTTPSCNTNLVEKRLLRCFLNRSVCACGHSLAACHRHADEKLQHTRRDQTRNDQQENRLTIVFSVRDFTTFDNVTAFICTCFTLQVNEKWIVVILSYKCPLPLIRSKRHTWSCISFILFTFFSSASYVSRSGKPRSVEIFTKNWIPSKIRTWFTNPRSWCSHYQSLQSLPSFSLTESVSNHVNC